MSEDKGIDGPLTARQLMWILWAPIIVAALIGAFVAFRPASTKPFDRAEFDREGAQLNATLRQVNEIEAQADAMDAAAGNLN